MTPAGIYDNIIFVKTKLVWFSQAGVAQPVEQLICNQQVGGSNPSTSSKRSVFTDPYLGEFPSGQRGQTVNLLSLTSMVRIHSLPPDRARMQTASGFFLF